jgi:hypothetical protein
MMLRCKVTLFICIGGQINVETGGGRGGNGGIVLGFIWEDEGGGGLK